MQKIRIRLPATLTDLGPGLQSLGIALGLYTQVQISPRSDDQLIVETSGIGAGYYATGLQHPVVLALVRIFQEFERSPGGITVRVRNEIPPASGLGAETAFFLAGLIGANTLLDTGLTQKQIIDRAAHMVAEPERAVAAMLGGLASCYVPADATPHYRNLPLHPFRLIVAIPSVDQYRPPVLSERLAQADVSDTLRRLPLFIEALRTGDLQLLSAISADRLRGSTITQQIPGFAHISAVARLAGARAVLTSGGGPAIIVITERDHDRIAEAVEAAFDNIDVEASVQVLPLDTQGVVISMMQSST